MNFFWTENKNQFLRQIVSSTEISELDKKQSDLVIVYPIEIQSGPLLYIFQLVLLKFYSKVLNQMSQLKDVFAAEILGQEVEKRSLDFQFITGSNSGE